jgi:hypothetical protein
MLLIDVLKSGHRPSLAVFMDGVNAPEPTDVPFFTNEVADAFRTRQFAAPARDFSWIPMVRFANTLRGRDTGGRRSAANDAVRYTDAHTRTAVNGFRQSRDISAAVSALYGVPTLFFLQPNAVHNYDVSLYRLSRLPEGFWNERTFATEVYRQLRADPAYIDLSTLFAEFGKRKAIVDDVHYNPAFNKFLAERVATFIELDDLVPRDAAEPTGAPR